MLPVYFQQLSPRVTLHVGSLCVFLAQFHGKQRRGGGENTPRREKREVNKHTDKSLMISTTSSTAEMVTQGKLQISEENIEGKYFILQYFV